MFDFDTQDGVDFLVMELVEGASLAERLKNGPLSEAEVTRLGIQIAEALDAAHRRQVIHRDLKPANILVTAEGEAKVLDFGLAKVLQDPGRADLTRSLTETEMAVGTVPYMAPEQLLGQQVDARTDLYALGVVLYELATGRSPYKEKIPTALVYEILNQPVLWPRELRSELSPRLEAIILRCLSKQPERRYRSAAELAADLGQPERPVAAPEPGGERRARHRLRLGLGVALALGVLAATVLALDVGHLRQRLLGGVLGGPIQSLAVLPLENLSRDPSQDYFVDGITEELINRVAQIGALRVISRTSVMGFKGSKLAIPEVARRLKVDAIVAGTVTRLGEQVKVTAELVQTNPERQLWGKTYLQRIGDVLAIQADLAGAIARELRLSLSPAQRARITKTREVNPKAHEAYLKGRFFLNKHDQKWVRSALEYFQKSAQIDPLYAQAWAGMADAYYGLSNIYLPPNVAMPRARAAAERALQLDPGLPEAHASLGVVLIAYDWDWAGAERELRRALELNPSLPQGHGWMGALLLITGRLDESIAEAQQGMKLDPLSIDAWVFGTWPYYVAGRYDEAIASWRQAKAVEPNYAPIHYNLGMAYEEKGMFPEAIMEMEKAVALWDNPVPLALLCHVYARAGRRREALSALKRLDQAAATQHVPAYWLAVAHTGLGNKDQAFRYLQQAYANRDEDINVLKVDPKLEELRSDPRFRDLLRRLDLEG